MTKPVKKPQKARPVRDAEGRWYIRVVKRPATQPPHPAGAFLAHARFPCGLWARGRVPAEALARLRASIARAEGLPEVGFVPDGAATKRLLRAPFKPEGADKGGRPRTRLEDTEMLSVRVPTSLKTLLMARAKENETTITRIVTAALEEWLEVSATE